MSGKPNSTEITALLMNFERLIVLRDCIKQNNELITSAKAMNVKHSEEYADLWKKSKALIEGMDIYREGNYGFEGRYHWFILELIKQAQAK